jgi:hypothetical protein
MAADADSFVRLQGADINNLMISEFLDNAVKDGLQPFKIATR